LSGYLLDTNVLSELVRKKPAREVVRRLRQLRNRWMTTSSVTANVRHFERIDDLRVESWWAEPTGA